jgi:hypothetical protein
MGVADSLFTDWYNVGSDYQARHKANAELIKQLLNSHDERITGVVGGTTMPEGLQEIFDRRGIVGKGSYDFSEGVLSGPNYYLNVAAGAYLPGAGQQLRRKTTATDISMSGQSTGTYYVNIGSDGTPTVESSADTSTARSFYWNDTTKAVSSKALYTGVNILLDGDDFADCLDSTFKSKSFTSLAARLEEIEEETDQWGAYYAEDPDNHSGLNFYYKAGKVRNDATITDTAAGSVALTDDTTNYVEVDPSTGTVSDNTTGFTSGKIPLFQVVTASGSISTVTDKRTSAITSGSGGSSHTQGTDLGTTSDEFTIDSDATGTPTGKAGIAVENGDNDNALVKFDRADGKWKWSVDGGTNWKEFYDPADIGSQELSRYVPIDDPPQAHLETGRSSSSAYEDLDLSSYFTQADLGVRLVTLAVFFNDTSPGSSVNVKFRRKGAAGAPAKSMTVWSGGGTDPGVIHVEPDSNGEIQFYVTASGTGTADLEIYLLNYVAKVTGVGTQEKTLTKTGISVPAGSSTSQDITGWCNRALVHHLKITETGGSAVDTYDIEIFGKDTKLAADLMYKAEGIDPTLDSRIWEDWEPWWFKDKDTTKELHIKITNNDASNAATFTLFVEAEAFN